MKHSFQFSFILLETGPVFDLSRARACHCPDESMEAEIRERGKNSISQTTENVHKKKSVHVTMHQSPDNGNSWKSLQ